MWLGALTLHLALLSAVLHASRRRRKRYSPASAVLLTELLKLGLSVTLVFLSGELDATMQQSAPHSTGAAAVKMNPAGQDVLAEGPRVADASAAPSVWSSTSTPPADFNPMPPSRLKLYTSRLLTMLESRSWLALSRLVHRGSVDVVVPAACFALQAHLQYIAAEHLSVPVSQLLYQLKVRDFIPV